MPQAAPQAQPREPGSLTHTGRHRGGGQQRHGRSSLEAGECVPCADGAEAGIRGMGKMSRFNWKGWTTVPSAHFRNLKQHVPQTR